MSSQQDTLLVSFNDTKMMREMEEEDKIEAAAEMLQGARTEQERAEKDNQVSKNMAEIRSEVGRLNSIVGEAEKETGRMAE